MADYSPAPNISASGNTGTARLFRKEHRKCAFCPFAKRERAAKHAVMERFYTKQLAIELLIISGIGLIFGFLGPFGTYAMPTAMRLAYWVVFILVGYAIFRPISFVAVWMSESSPVSFPIAIGIALLVAGLPLAIMIGFMINGFRWDGPMLQDEFALLYVQVVAIGLGIFLLMYHLFRRDEVDPQLKTSQTSSENLREARGLSILSRLPTGFPDNILALGVEDHYVRVHAPDRNEMLLMRLGDAIAEMEGVDGMQVHRSWWVARDALITAKRDGRNWRLMLSSGLEVPVARTYVTKLKDAGWIN